MIQSPKILNKISQKNTFCFYNPEVKTGSVFLSGEILLRDTSIVIVFWGTVSFYSVSTRVSKFQISTKKLQIIWVPQNPSIDKGRLTPQRRSYRFHLQKELCNCEQAEVEASSVDDNARNFDSGPPGVCRCVVFHMTGYVL